MFQFHADMASNFVFINTWVYNFCILKVQDFWDVHKVVRHWMNNFLSAP